MKIIMPSVEILTPLDGEAILRHIEFCGRTCYKSANADGSFETTKRFIKDLLRFEHEAMLEHYSFTVKFICDRGVMAELTRHRLSSFAVESTRYSNYSKDKFGNEITVIKPYFFEEGSVEYAEWEETMLACEKSYLALINSGATPERARSVLPTSLKTEVIMTSNLREWRHFLKLRAQGTTGAPHPQMKEVALPLLNMLKERIPIIFDDING